MPAQGWEQSLVRAASDGTAVTGTALASLLPTPAIFTLPGNFLERVGQTLRIRAAGRISNIVTTPGTLTLSVRLGGAVIAAVSSAMQLNAVAKTNVTWHLDWELTARSLGSGTLATVIHLGSWRSESVVGSPLPSAGGAGTHMIPAAAPAAGTGFSSVAAQTVDLMAQFSLTGNSMTLHQFQLESID